MSTVQAVGNVRTIFAQFTRPSNTTQYAAGDVVNDSTSAPTVMTFSKPARESGPTGGGSIIQQAILIDSAAEATKLDCELWLFDTTITPDNDNAAFTPTDAELLTLVGIISFPASGYKVGTASGNSVCQVDNLGLPVNTVAGPANSLFGVLVARNAYTPISAEVFKIVLKLID